MHLFLRNVEGVFFKVTNGLGEDGNVYANIVALRGIKMDANLYQAMLSKVFKKVNKVAASVSKLAENRMALSNELNKEMRVLFAAGKIEFFDITAEDDFSFYGQNTAFKTNDRMMSHSPYTTLRETVRDYSQSLH